MNILFRCLLALLMFCGPAMGENGDFGRSLLAANSGVLRSSGFTLSEAPAASGVQIPGRLSSEEMIALRWGQSSHFALLDFC